MIDDLRTNLIGRSMPRPSTMRPSTMRPSTMRASIGGAALLVLALAAACAPQGPAPEVEESLKASVLAAVPADVPNKLRIDFESRVQLVGYELLSGPVAAPGSLVRVKLYFQSSSPVGAGFAVAPTLLTTHGPLTEANGQPLGARSRLTQGLPPSAWQVGKVYVDEVLVAVPRFTTAPQLTFAVAIAREQLVVRKAAVGADPTPAPSASAAPEPGPVVTTLAVTSGASDGKGRAVLFTLPTGVTPERAKTLAAEAAAAASAGMLGQRPAVPMGPGGRQMFPGGRPMGPGGPRNPHVPGGAIPLPQGAH